MAPHDEIRRSGQAVYLLARATDEAACRFCYQESHSLCQLITTDGQHLDMCRKCVEQLEREVPKILAESIV